MDTMVGCGATLTTEIMAFAAAYMNVILIPGPSFVVVCEAGLTASRREASLVALGVACGAAVLSSTILKLAPLLHTTPGLMATGQIGCALILLGMGLRLLRRSLRGTGAVAPHRPGIRASERFITGFVAAATNPVSFASFTTAALAFDTTALDHDCGIIAVMIFAMAIGWFNTLAIAFSQPLLTSHYPRVARILGSLMGCVLMAKALWVLVPAL